MSDPEVITVHASGSEVDPDCTEQYDETSEAFDDVSDTDTEDLPSNEGELVTRISRAFDRGDDVLPSFRLKSDKVYAAKPSDIKVEAALGPSPRWSTAGRLSFNEWVRNNTRKEKRFRDADTLICSVCNRDELHSALMRCDGPYCFTSQHTFCVPDGNPIATPTDVQWFCGPGCKAEWFQDDYKKHPDRY